MARQWHPDVCKEPNASDQFRRIQQAYEVLGEPMTRKRYDAGLMFEKSLTSSPKRVYKPNYFTPPYRSGFVTADVKPMMWRFLVEMIHAWDDIVNEAGQVMVSSWPKGSDQFQIIWV
jgi:curved DNA-binding protein CbpA